MSVQPIYTCCIRCGNRIPWMPGSFLCGECIAEKVKLDLEWLLDL